MLRHGHGHGAPRGHGGRLEGAAGSSGVVYAGVGGGEEDEDGGCNEDGAEGPDTLGKPLLPGRGAEEEADAEVAREVCGLVGAHTGEGATEEVQGLRLGNGPALGFGGAAEDDLRGFGGTGEGSDVWKRLEERP